jgi:hypothetical protein
MVIWIYAYMYISERPATLPVTHLNEKGGIVVEGGVWPLEHGVAYDVEGVAEDGTAQPRHHTLHRRTPQQLLPTSRE